jgi:phage tail-like protein
MGVYGVDIYGQARFGRDPNLIRPDFSVDPFQATAVDYSTLHLTWQKPNSADCTYLRLVRNPSNLPQDEDDGTYLWGNANTTPTYSDFVQRTASFTDNRLGGGFYYYTMWGWSSSDQVWIRCSDLVALVPLNWGYGYRLYNMLPMAYRDADILLVDPYNPWPENSPQPPLQRYLNLLGFQMDFIRTELESLMSVNDPLNCSGTLLPLLAQQLGLPNEPEIGMQQERTLIDNAIHLYKLKGSPRGISEFVSILTSYPMSAMTHHGYNALLCRDDSIGETSVGTWHWTNPTYTFTQIPNLLDGSIAGMTNPLETYTGFEPGPNPTYNNTGIRINSATTGDRYMRTAPIPITDFMSTGYGQGFITWRIQIWSAVSRQVGISVWGDYGNGPTVPVIPEQSFTETAGHWTLMTVTGNVNPYSGGPGTTASYYWLVPQIHIVGAAANEHHYMTLMGLWPCQPGDIGINTPVYDYPRDVKVIVSPQSSNLLSNTLTDFTDGFDGVTAATDPTLPSSNFSSSLTIHYVGPEDPAAIYSVNGIASLQIAASAPGSAVWFGLVSAWTTPAPTLPQGWFTSPATNWTLPVDTGDWFPSEVLTYPPRTWFDPVNGWFIMNNEYFSVGAATEQGNWFPPAAQPPQNGNLAPFVVPPNQPFNFSVYAKYLTVADPSNAVMDIGFRWYYPDGTYTEVFTAYTITDSWARYACPPSLYPWMADPPDEAVTYAQPTSMFPFVRFPYAQQAIFLLNSAMLSPTQSLQPFMDITMFPGNSDYIEDSHGATYFYRHRVARMTRLESELYRWIPMGASHSEIYGAEASVPPLDPTLWLHPAVAMIGTSTLGATAS